MPLPGSVEDYKKYMLFAAKRVSGQSYSPYSHFAVGAAVFTDAGIFTGCNVENASYGLTICAERNAIFKAIGNCAKKILAVTVYTPTQKPVMPCGACRQVINEFGPDAQIICCCDSEQISVKTLKELLPEAFGPQDLT